MYRGAYLVGVAGGSGSGKTTLVRALRDRVSGLAQPHYVIDIPGGVSKALASPADVETEDGRVRLRGRDGVWREY